MANIRVAASASSQNPLTIPGTTRKYLCGSGSYVDAIDQDAWLLVAAGWTQLTPKGGTVGPTSGRPTAALKGTPYTDTTVGALVISDGAGNWLHHMTGAVS